MTTNTGPGLNEKLVDQLDFHWRVHLRPRLSGLTDAGVA